MYIACPAHGRPAHAGDGAIDFLEPEEVADCQTLLAAGQQHELLVILLQLNADSLF